MKIEIDNLKQKFFEIKSMGYVKSTRRGSTGIGKTFEDLLGKEEDSLCLPDFQGIEIKTRRGYSKSYITLFNSTIMGEEPFQTKRIKDTYGYPDKLDKRYKVLNCSFFSNQAVLVANKYFFKLKVNIETQKIYLVICDKNFNILESNAYWRFDVLRDKLKTKLNYLAVIKAWPKRVNGVEYYNYYNLKIYKLNSFEKFINLIQNGKIRVTFKICTYRSGDKEGETCDHGTSFQIKEEDLDQLFKKIY